MLHDFAIAFVCLYPVSLITDNPISSLFFCAICGVIMETAGWFSNLQYT